MSYLFYMHFRKNMLLPQFSQPGLKVIFLVKTLHLHWIISDICFQSGQYQCGRDRKSINFLQKAMEMVQTWFSCYCMLSCCSDMVYNQQPKNSQSYLIPKLFLINNLIMFRCHAKCENKNTKKIGKMSKDFPYVFQIKVEKVLEKYIF